MGWAIAEVAILGIFFLIAIVFLIIYLITKKEIVYWSYAAFASFLYSALSNLFIFDNTAGLALVAVSFIALVYDLVIDKKKVLDLFLVQQPLSHGPNVFL